MAKPVVPGEQCRVGQPARRGGAVAVGGHRPERHGPVRRALRAVAGTFTGPAGTFRQRTELTKAQTYLLA